MQPTAEPHTLHPPTFWQALAYWLKLGCISFGGPAGQIALMHAELVHRRRWVSDGRFNHALGYCMVLPGPEAQQLATYLGWLLHGVRGGLAAGVLFVLPSLLLLFVLSWAYVVHGQVAWVAALFAGIKPAVVVVVLYAAWRMASRTLKTWWLWGIAVAALSAVLLGLSFVWVVLAAALAGLTLQRLQPAALGGASAGAGEHGNPTKGHAVEKLPPSQDAAAHGLSGGALSDTLHNTSKNPPLNQPRAFIDDDTPTPGHARVSVRTLLLVLVCGGLLGVLPYLWLSGFAAAPLLQTVAQFFTQAALLTFGGAYAVLPYVFDASVQQYGWLSAGQMMDGMALGESTPGPLIMVVTFIGFLAGAQSDWAAAKGAGGLWLGVLSGWVATWYTFLPSFIFIFAGAPWIERTRGKLWLVAPLQAVSAAVLGVMLSLVWTLAKHTFSAASVSVGTLDYRFWVLSAIAAGSAVALWRFHRSVIEVLLGGAFIGWLAL